MIKIDPSVVALNVHGSEAILIRSGPTDIEVKDFVAEHNRRHGMGEPGGMHDFNDGRPPASVPAQFIKTAHRYESESAFLDDKDSGEELTLYEEPDASEE